MLNLILPEKEWFTFEEMANRWQVDIDTVAHYVWDLHLLRPAIVLKELDFDCLQYFMSVPDGCDRDKKLIPCGYKQFIKNKNGSEYDGKFLYVKTQMPDCDEEAFSLFRDFTFTVDLVPNRLAISEDKPYYYEPLGECFTDFDGVQIFFSMMACKDDARVFERCIPGVPVSNDYFITKEERDRFEEQYRKQEIQNTGKRQEENSLYALGMMAILLAEKSSLYKIGDRPNSEQIARAVNELADKCNFDSSSIKSLHKKISEGLKKINNANGNLIP